MQLQGSQSVDQWHEERQYCHMPVPQHRKWVPERHSHSLPGRSWQGPQRQSLAQTW